MAASEADGCAGVGIALGRLVGRACARKTGRVGRPVGLAGWRGPSRPRRLARPTSFLFLFLFCCSFLLFYLNLNLVLEFEFQIGAPNLLEF